MILQRIKAKTNEINRYQQRVSQFQQNRFFRNNEGWFYKQTDGSKKGEEIVTPDTQEAKKHFGQVFRAKKWNIIRMKLGKEKLRKIWMGRTNRHECRFCRRSLLKKILKKISDWKVPGQDGVQGFWLKNFIVLHKNLIWHLNTCLERETPRWMINRWMIKGRTVLIQKDKSKGNEAGNYYPIMCFSLIWKLLTGIIVDEIYGFLENKGILPEEQKVCRRKSKGAGD